MSIFCLTLICPPHQLFASAFIELVTAETATSGRILERDENHCWLASQDGSYHRVTLAEVTSFRQLSGNFRAFAPSELIEPLRKEFRHDYEVRWRGEHVVVASKGNADRCLTALHDVSRNFNTYFSRRQIPLPKREFPFIVIIFASRAEFQNHCQKLDIPVTPNMMGYYDPASNRVYLDQNDLVLSDFEETQFSRTLIHESIHQLAFNSGLHSRLGSNPRWLVEGLAIMLESGGFQANPSGPPQNRINPQRLARFQDYRDQRRGNLTIADLIASDDQLFESSPLDAYSEFWALTFFLMETRRVEFLRYLRKTAEQSSSTQVTAQDRISDFQSCFGTDLQFLEVQFLRFMDQLKISSR